MQHGCPLHRASIVGVQDERLLIKEQALGQDGFSDEMAGMFGGFFLPHFPAHDIAAEDVENEVEVVVEPLDGAGKVSDVPGPDLVGRSGDKAGYSPPAGLLASAAVTDLGCFMHDSVETRFRRNIGPFIGQRGYDLAGWFVRILRPVHGL